MFHVYLIWQHITFVFVCQKWLGVGALMLVIFAGLSGTKIGFDLCTHINCGQLVYLVQKLGLVMLSCCLELVLVILMGSWIMSAVLLTNHDRVVDENGCSLWNVQCWLIMSLLSDNCDIFYPIWFSYCCVVCLSHSIFRYTIYTRLNYYCYQLYYLNMPTALL